MKARVLLPGLGLLAGAALVLSLAGASSAAAIDPAGVQTVVVGGPSVAVLPLQVDQLYPGSGTHARFVLRRGATWFGGSFAASVIDVEDLERGCNRSERHAGDITCGDGADQGELSQQLLVNASWTQDVASCATAAAPTGGTAMRLARGLPVLATSEQPSHAVCLVLSLELPSSADNLVQSDLVRFSLQLGLEDAVLTGRPRTPAVVQTPSAQEPAGPSPSHSPSSASPGPSSSSPDISPSPIAGVDEQPAQATPGPTSSTTSPSPSPTGIASASPAAAMTQRPQALPFTGGRSLLLVGWAALLVFAGYVATHAARQRRA